ncbi:hypothetical protein GCM10022239_12640 [Leifsonia bigeumensis]|uniref:TPM domain-containing protein n=1 Tax=Leifsonella bigeumensis TaxID=433643 RepID=A0ABP7FG14_9MICO
MGGELVSAAWTVGITLVVIFVLAVGAGFWLLARRTARQGRVGQGRSGQRRAGRREDALGALQQKANILLVRADDAVKNAEDELGFAIAQFGDVTSQEFERVLVTARSDLREAFGLQQKLDDAHPDTETQRREWSARIVHLCESTQDALDAQEKAFAARRELEKNAPADLAAVGRAIEALDARMAASTATLATLRSDYSASAIASVADNLDRAAQEREKATSAADRAQEALDGRDGEAVADARPATDLIREAGEGAYRAGRFLDAIDALRDELGKASDAVTSLRGSTQKNLAEARALRDAPPDADSSAAVGRAIGTVERALAAHALLTDPLATLEVLRAANAELDSSMAGARNQQRRLDGARTALVGALVGARSQLTATRNFITTRRGGVGAEARTRLAEAERLLAVAEAESDPVAALDTARSSATYSRDADALARFDLLGR